MVLLYWYIVIGVVLGLLSTYKLVQEYGWEYLCEDFNAIEVNQAHKISFTVEEFKIAFPIGVILLAVVSWPYFIYLLFKNYLK